jgi:hypothetical protein
MPWVSPLEGNEERRWLWHGKEFSRSQTAEEDRGLPCQVSCNEGDPLGTTRSLRDHEIRELACSGVALQAQGTSERASYFIVFIHL